MSYQYGKYSSSFIEMVSGFLSSFLVIAYECQPLDFYLFYSFMVYLLVCCDDIYHRSITNPCIPITIKLIDSDLITDIIRDFFGPYI